MDTEAHFNTAATTVSLLGQVFRGCTDGFALWRQAEDFGSDAVLFKIQLDWQASKLQAWLLDWGVQENDHLMETKFQQYGTGVINYLTLINFLVNDLKSLDHDYPNLAAATTNPDITALMRLSELSEADSLEQKKLRDKILETRSQSNVNERFKWALADGQANKTLALIKSLIDEIYQFFPPPKRDNASPLVLNKSLSTSNPQTLSMIENSVSDSELLSSIAWLKLTSKDAEERKGLLSAISVRQNWPRSIDQSTIDRKNARSKSRFQGQDVLIEWKSVETAGKDFSEFTTLGTRIENVARLLKYDKKPKELRTLHCLGVIQQVQTKRTEYGLLYTMPSSNFFSLRDVLRERKETFLLGDRFIIAQVLSRAVLFLHLSGWFHKGIRSSNVLFFASTCGEIDPEYPYLVGFEHSRLDEKDAQTEDVAGDLEFNLYRHPDMQGLPIAESSDEKLDEESQGPSIATKRPRFNRMFDIYSLGVILVELGSRKSAVRMCSDFNKDATPAKEKPKDFHAWMMEREVSKLGVSMGRGYMEATALCLKGNFDIKERTLGLAFYLDVVKPLQRCCA